ncbi:PREDICTED: uncharacterized protein LOC108558037 [Nicrophorus vespilloides]|uniref:Uncharacterized protein LOC108558037 n=1 Tax=Nicrophorus vespilloides TaxID=110193 RepID=A0ABM1M6W3_NICVS|nr:PREDICTED: uncharacterized protein LOC108558037 [Nicrophorus vespilloides]
MKLALIAFALLVAVSAAPTYDFDGIVENIPEEDRLHFLRFHIKRGYELSQQKQARFTDELGDDFSVALYNFAKSNHAITDQATLTRLYEVICFDDGDCIDIGDPGIHP